MEINPMESPGFLIARLSHLLRTRITQTIRDHNLSLSTEEHQVLIVLAGQREPVRVVDLARLLMRDPTTVKRQLNRLLDEQLVNQKADPRDGRVVLLEVSAKGKDAARITEEPLEKLRETAMEGVGEEDRQALVRSLQRMQANLLAAPDTY